MIYVSVDLRSDLNPGRFGSELTQSSALGSPHLHQEGVPLRVALDGLDGHIFSFPNRLEHNSKCPSADSLDKQTGREPRGRTRSSSSGPDLGPVALHRTYRLELDVIVPNVLEHHRSRTETRSRSAADLNKTCRGRGLIEEVAFCSDSLKSERT